jgi:hypothetical protein
MHHPPHKASALSNALLRLQSLPPDRPFTLRNLVTLLGDKGFGLLLMILALPSALPVPAPGYSTPFGIVIFILGCQMLAGRHGPSLPEKLGQKRISPHLIGKAGAKAAWFFRLIEYVIRPRLTWITKPVGMRLLAVLVLIMSMLMILPIPLTNTAPAGVIFLIGLGITEQDGLFALGAVGVAFAATALYTLVLYFAAYLIIHHGWSGLDELKTMVKAFLERIF